MGEISSRKWLVTINNPVDHGFTHESIELILSSVHGSTLYWCYCDEIGDAEKTLHTHIFIYRDGPFKASQIAALFPDMHRDNCRGTAQDNRAYVLKDGDKYNKDDKGHYNYVDTSGKWHTGTNLSETFKEFGVCPQEHQGKSRDADIIVSLIKDGATNQQIVDAVSSSYKDIDKIERTRSMYRDSSFTNVWRDMQVTYVFGTTGSGKTRGVMDKYGYGNCYRVTDYKHPFDQYDGQDVLIFEEYRSQFKIFDILNYLDGYPLLLPCRYFNRQACFTKVFILSNVPLESQYSMVDGESRKAFLRRIGSVVEYAADGIQTYASLADYKNRTCYRACTSAEYVEVENVFGR